MKVARLFLSVAVVVVLLPGFAAADQLQLDPDVLAIGQSAMGGGGGGGPMGHFNLTPKIGYMYLGGQGGYTSASNASFGGASANCMHIRLDLTWGGPGGQYTFAPYYLMQDYGGGSGNYVHGVGIYNAYLFTWEVDGGKSGYWYPEVGFGTGIGFAIGGGVDWGTNFWLHLPFGVTWYPSKSTKVGIELAAGIGFQTSFLYQSGPFSNSSYLFLSYGVEADVMLGVKFF
jgi:hypothetical protein